MRCLACACMPAFAATAAALHDQLQVWRLHRSHLVAAAVTTDLLSCLLVFQPVGGRLGVLPLPGFALLVQGLERILALARPRLQRLAAVGVARELLWHLSMSQCDQESRTGSDRQQLRLSPLRDGCPGRCHRDSMPMRRRRRMIGCCTAWLQQSWRCAGEHVSGALGIYFDICCICSCSRRYMCIPHETTRH